MANAFYRSSSSSAKKNSDRERRQSAVFVSEESSDAAPSSAAAEETPSRRSAPSRPESREGRGVFAWRANITPSALVTMSVLALVMLGFSFLSGVIVGRSSMPLPQALELDTLLSEEPKAEEGAQEEPEKILPKEELKFMTSLKSDAAGGVLADAEKNSAPAAVTQEKAKSEKPKPEVEKPREPQFDYVLRVAAFKEAGQAQTLVARLSKDGMRARRTQAKTGRTTWYYVQVLLRGGKADLQVLRRKLDGYGLHDAMLISEKAVKGR